MSKQRTYSDFDLLIEGSGGEGYRARVVDSPAGQAAGSFDFPFSDAELEIFLLKVGRPRRGVRRLESPEMEAARAFGKRLYEAVFQDDLRLSLRRSLDEVERRDEGLRIRLWFSDAPELASLPWEFLFSESDDQFLVLSAWTPIVRYLDLSQAIEPLTVTGPLRILAMISSPHDFPALDVEEEWRRIEDALRPLVERGAVVIDRTDDATLLELSRMLRRNEYHIFHFLGHGGFDEKADDGVLVLEDGNNRSRLVAGRDVGTILRDHRSLRLAVLNACEGARAGDIDPFSGAAQSLVRKGIPGVVAMQFEITDEAAIAFASEFYSAIADGLPVDAALGEARRAIFGQGNDIEWGTPVVYLRGDGRLFEVEPAGAADAAAAAVVVEQRRDEVPLVTDQGPPESADSVVEQAPEPDNAEVEPTVFPAAAGPPEYPNLWERMRELPGWAWGVLLLVPAVVLAGGFSLFTGDGSPTTGDGRPTLTTDDGAPESPIVIAPDAEATAQRTAQPKTIDGLVDDWPGLLIHTTDHVFYQAAAVRNDPSTRAGEENDSEVQLAWDETNLYIFAVVQDDVWFAPYTDSTEIWQYDAVSLNITGPDGIDHQLTLSPGDPEAGTAVESAHYVVGGSTLNTGFAELAALPGTSSGYVIEAAIPWSEIDVLPVPGAEFTMLLTVFDNDGEPFPQAEIKANTPPGGEPLEERWFRDPAAWGTLTLEG